MQRINKKGFTLVEILIVVIILGILAAIVIPQFSNASTDAKKNSLTSQLQTMRSQIELYKLQHNDKMPVKFQTDGVYGAVATDWEGLTSQTDVAGATTAAATVQKYGPYLQQVPTNSLNGSSIIAVDSVSDFPSLDNQDSPNTTAGFIMNQVTGKIWATSSKMTKIYNEGKPSAPENDL